MLAAILGLCATAAGGIGIAAGVLTGGLGFLAAGTIGGLVGGGLGGFAAGYGSGQSGAALAESTAIGAVAGTVGGFAGGITARGLAASVAAGGIGGAASGATGGYLSTGTLGGTLEGTALGAAEGAAFGGAGYTLGEGLTALRDAYAAENITATPYGDVRGTLPEGFQANHLNQNAVFGSVIPREEGLAIGMEGNAFTEVGTPLYNFHQSLEQFWEQYRPNNALFGSKPTNAEYSQALEGALQAAGYTPAQAADLASQAAAQRAAYGLNESDLVPRIPGRINQVPPEG